MSDAPHVVLGVTGSISAYKSADLVRHLIDESWVISAVMTQSATAYIGELTLRALTGREVAVGRFEDLSPDGFQHIELARGADVILIAPCTANVFAKIAHGMADDLLTATVLACDKPIVVAPAMNDTMWSNLATQGNVDLLRERGVHVLDVGHGSLACGEVGAGRLLELDKIVAAVRHILIS